MSRNLSKLGQLMVCGAAVAAVGLSVGIHARAGDRMGFGGRVQTTDIKFPRFPTPEIPGIPEVRLPDPRRWTELSTNRDRVRSEIRQGWQGPTAVVVLGQEIDHEREKGMAAAIAASFATGNAGPALAYLEALAIEQREAFIRNAEGEAKRVAANLSQTFLHNAFEDLLNRNFRTYRINNAEVQVGIATYSHWKKTVFEYPEFKHGRIEWTRQENTFPFPNTFEPYIRVRIIVDEQHHGGAEQQFRTGRLVVQNDYGGAVAIILYHPADFSREFATWQFAPTERSFLNLNDNTMVIGSDWQISILFGNGVRSPHRTVGDISTYENGEFHVRATKIFN